jgi:hypothetical protein
MATKKATAKKPAKKAVKKPVKKAAVKKPVKAKAAKKPAKKVTARKPKAVPTNSVVVVAPVVDSTGVVTISPVDSDVVVN